MLGGPSLSRSRDGPAACSSHGPSRRLLRIATIHARAHYLDADTAIQPHPLAFPMTSALSLLLLVARDGHPRRVPSAAPIAVLPGMALPTPSVDSPSAAPIPTPIAMPMAIQIPIDFVASGVMSDPSGQSESSRQRSARAMPGWDILTVVGVTLVLLVMYAQGLSRQPYDFGAYYFAAEDLRAGRNPYEQALAWRAAGHVTGSPDAPPVAGIAYVYPPALALALMPLTALPLPLATAVWLGLLVGCVVGTAWCLATLLTSARGSDFWLLVALLVLGIALFKPVRARSPSASRSIRSSWRCWPAPCWRSCGGATGWPACCSASPSRSSRSWSCWRWCRSGRAPIGRSSWPGWSRRCWCSGRCSRSACSAISWRRRRTGAARSWRPARSGSRRTRSCCGR